MVPLGWAWMLEPSGPSLLYEVYYKLIGEWSWILPQLQESVACWALGVLTNRKDSSGLPQSSSLNFHLYSIFFINDLIENIKGLFTKFAVDLKGRSGEEERPKNRLQTHRQDPDGSRLDWWAESNKIKWNKDKCQSLNLPSKEWLLQDQVGLGGTAVTLSQHLAGFNKTVAWDHMVIQPWHLKHHPRCPLQHCF